MPPRLIADRYQLLREVSRAPDATYWQADDTLLDRQVLVELLRAELAADAGAVERFRDALRVTARAGASAHGRLLDGGTDPEAGLPFAVFEWDEAPPPVEEPGSPPPAPAAPSHRRVATRGSSRNLALPVLLTALPLAIGAIVVFKVLSTSGQSVAPVFALPTVEIALTLGARPAIATATPAPAVVRTPAPTRAVTPTPTGERVRIANTDGIGVALRDGPGGQRLPGKGYDEGVTVTVLERQGDWAHIRGDDGRQGWVLAVTVPPAR